ncbi:MAG: hypothetical protein LBL66_06825 [Clostridiales bacterium]|jgi:bifunctional N-acetylglucosamine-1-phosphate-uridyltransferase/glucosamine-1-phosphate-acetyltransferase GlmU-like protein|nr:hypothetical protein [Clostridiales bacterium]
MDLDVSVYGILLLVENPAFGREAPYNIRLAGKPMRNWTLLALNDASHTELVYNGEDVAAFVRPYARESDYTAVLYSDTPLFQRKTLLEILKFVRDNKLNVCRLTRGWVFRTSFLRDSDGVVAGKTYYFDEEDFLTVSDFGQAALIGDVLRQRILQFHMRNGVQITDTGGAFIDGDVKIGKNVTIQAGNILSGRTVIGDGAVLKPYNVIDDSVIGEGAEISASHLCSCAVGKNTRVGPNAYIRPQSVIGDDCRIGDFVEVKNARIGNGTKAAHLSYIGDADVGERCNIGCGTVFVNYDGKNKRRSTVGSGVFIGSNANLVAPVRLEDGSFIAAGSTVTGDVPAGALAIARARQVNKTDWKKPT